MREKERLLGKRYNTYLRDETGGRRFWPVRCTEIKIDDLARDRNQLWAQAVVRFRDGAVWWFDSPELNHVAEQEQASRYDGDPWEYLIAAWLEHPTARYDCGSPIAPFTSTDESVSVPDALRHCIGKPQEQWPEFPF